VIRPPGEQSHEASRCPTHLVVALASRSWAIGTGQDLRREEANRICGLIRAGGLPRWSCSTADRSTTTTSDSADGPIRLDGCWWVAPRWSQPLSPHRQIRRCRERLKYRALGLGPTTPCRVRGALAETERLGVPCNSQETPRTADNQQELHQKCSRRLCFSSG